MAVGRDGGGFGKRRCKMNEKGQRSREPWKWQGKEQRRNGVKEKNTWFWGHSLQLKREVTFACNCLCSCTLLHNDLAVIIFFHFYLLFPLPRPPPCYQPGAIMESQWGWGLVFCMNEWALSVSASRHPSVREPCESMELLTQARAVMSVTVYSLPGV